MNSKLFIFDPAMFAQNFLELDRWLLLMNNNITSLLGTVCSHGAFQPSSQNCFNETFDLNRFVTGHNSFLLSEFNNLRNLRLNPLTLLGLIFFLFKY
jgi:hypothetical protein